MLPLSDWSLAARRNIIGVFTDIDDTLTTDGAITADCAGMDMRGGSGGTGYDNAGDKPVLLNWNEKP